MPIASLWGLAAACLPALFPVPGAGPPPPAAPVSMPEPPRASVARARLAELVVRRPGSMKGYSPAQFPHWVEQGGNCDTREIVLHRDGENVKEDRFCRAVSGTWHSAYDGKTLRSASRVKIGHLVPLADAWRSGADGWSMTRRQEFANDLTNPQLIAVSASSDQAKEDQSPDQWRPRRSYWCLYARAWTDVKHRYKLSVTAKEKTALDQMLDTCPDRQHP
ncbi:HNH endonuclease family protein [Sphaerisporangium sp. NPDC088356]|uniref:HNH endonuclease family protein n=1 Tax=Sphaerisporangium sp. NPDC088356 TaxID=3154871 RepID=UPI003443F118